MTNEEFVRRAYDIAEAKDIPGWIACFTPDGVFVDESVGITYTGPDEVAKPVENYGRAFSDMHRELYDVYVSGDVVIVELGRAHPALRLLPVGNRDLGPARRARGPRCGVGARTDSERLKITTIR
jgi:ketosteroid isomerase-like protein